MKRYLRVNNLLKEQGSMQTAKLLFLRKEAVKLALNEFKIGNLGASLKWVF